MTLFDDLPLDRFFKGVHDLLALSDLRVETDFRQFSVCQFQKSSALAVLSVLRSEGGF